MKKVEEETEEKLVYTWTPALEEEFAATVNFIREYLHPNEEEPEQVKKNGEEEEKDEEEEDEVEEEEQVEEEEEEEEDTPIIPTGVSAFFKPALSSTVTPEALNQANKLKLEIKERQRQLEEAIEDSQIEQERKAEDLR